MQGKKILVVDDDFHARRLIERSFTKAGAEVSTAADGREGLRQFYAQRPDLVILDVMMPELDGYETCRQIRMLSDVPVIMLARVRAILRRSKPTFEAERRITYNDKHMEVDLDAHRVNVEGKEVRLTPKEFQLLAYLLQNAGRARTFDQILENVWGWEYQGSMDYVHVYVSHLRGKIEKDPKNPLYIQSVHGVGYRFEKQSP
jgi:two-component system alkaline phosphatase synthesis response regulator PhoP